MSQANPRVVLVGAGIFVILAFLFGFFFGASAQTRGALPEAFAQSLGIQASPPEGVDLSPLWAAWAVIDEKFVPASVASTSTSSPLVQGTEEERRVWGMIQGLSESLGDPYTFFLPPVEQKQFEEDLAGNFEGVGMEIAVKNKVLTVVAPLKGTPAERAGMEPGDLVLKIDGVETIGMDITTAVNRIRGPKGSIVTLFVMREGWKEPRDVQVTRDVINIPVLEYELRSDGIYVISLHNFTANSPLLFRDALRKFVESGSSRLILDLRGNPGGYLEASVEMASWFLPAGKIVVTEDYAGNAQKVDHRSRGYNVFNDTLKMVVLVDRGSASASEILAGALKHHNIATLVGTATFGKGSVQELVPITSNTSLKITVARWLMPNGEQIPSDGIKPDTEVKIPEDVRPGDDPQLDKAVELLK